MVKFGDIQSSLLQKPDPSSATLKPPERIPSAYHPLHTFHLKQNRSYKQQYDDMYFLRLTKLKPTVEAVATSAWEGTVIGGEPVRRVNRVLDVQQGELCWVVGTVYMELRLKPNILDDVTNDRWISDPIEVEKYFANDGTDRTMLEDDSGRIQIVGDMLKNVNLVTGCIVAVMGTENSDGEFEVVDMEFANLPPQPPRWALTKNATIKSEYEGMEDAAMLSPSTKIALVSGLSFSSIDSAHATELQLLLEFLLGESLDSTAQQQVARISRLIIAGNSIVPHEPKAVASAHHNGNKENGSNSSSHKKYGYDASSYNPVPSQLLDEFLAEVLPSMPVTLLPGSHDPSNVAYPQQPVHMTMFPRARAYVTNIGPGVASGTDTAAPNWFDSVTNPWEGEVDGWRVLGTGGQNVDDVSKYVDTNDRLGMMEAMCQWRCIAPTAPDTLWSYPFQENDPFILTQAPHLYFVGCQPEFGTRIAHGPDGQAVRLVTVPSFADTHELVLVDTNTLEVERVKIVVG